MRQQSVDEEVQVFNLLATLTALENITLPMDSADRKPDQAWVERVVATVGLTDRLKHRPTELSGGQQQRISGALARGRLGDV